MAQCDGRRAVLDAGDQLRDAKHELRVRGLVAPLPLAPPRGGGAEPDPDAVERYARGVLSALARTGINRQLAELRARQRRMSSDDEGYRELFEQIVGLENRRMQIAQLS